ncbi:kinase-like domain-containing protein [Cladochytrium replicatum]|nr:kinase-like domain-containing protein [Cladochytrium replicatum]
MSESTLASSVGSPPQTDSISDQKPPTSTGDSLAQHGDISGGEENYEDDASVSYLAAKSADEFEIVAALGEGTYGFVRLVHHKLDRRKRKLVLKYVLKNRILRECWTRDKELGGLVPIEVQIMHRLRAHPHPHIVRMLAYFQDDDFFYILMEVHGFGLDLFDWVEMNQDVSEDQIRHIFLQTALAVQHLHAHNVVHRDIKDENIILDEDAQIQLIDFGSAAIHNPQRKFETFSGTLDYAAPEVLTGHKYDGRPQDVWALGVLLYTLIYKENPFYNIDEIISRDLRIPFVLSQGSLDLIKYMLNRDVKRRPTIDEVLAHPWLHEGTAVTAAAEAISSAKAREAFCGCAGSGIIANGGSGAAGTNGVPAGDS